MGHGSTVNERLWHGDDLSRRRVRLGQIE